SFQTSRKGPERGLWFVYTLLIVITHFTSSRTSNLLRCLQTLLELPLTQRRFYAFMASPKLPWPQLWATLWSLIPEPAVKVRLLFALDDYINPKTGKKGQSGFRKGLKTLISHRFPSIVLYGIYSG
ncbi:MAG: hypothetical protein P8179_24865, partial [Candidatus Thiodiazotropha sp.]